MRTLATTALGFILSAAPLHMRPTDTGDAGTGDAVPGDAGTGDAVPDQDDVATPADTRVPEEFPLVEVPDEPLPTSGFDKSAASGLFIQSADGQFRLNIGMFTQLRYNLNQRTAEADTGTDLTNGSSVNRTRVYFTGHYTEYFGYHFRTNTNSTGDSELLVAYIQLNPSDAWYWRIGRQFMALSREDWMLAPDTLTTEFSPNDFTFAIGTSNGIKAHHMAATHRTWFAVHNGAVGGKEAFPSQTAADIAFTARHEWQAAGTDWSVWDDLVGRPGRANGVLLGAAGGYQFRDRPTATLARHAAQLNLDASINGDGYQGMVAGSATWREPEQSSSYTNYGVMAQYGHFLSEELQGYGQFNWVSPGDQPGDLSSFRSLALGVNWFPFAWTNRWKFSFEGGHLFDAINETIVSPSGSLGWLASDESGQTYLRVQAQFGF